MMPMMATFLITNDSHHYHYYQHRYATRFMAQQTEKKGEMKYKERERCVEKEANLVLLLKIFYQFCFFFL